MGTITINVKDEVEKQFRETVKKEIGVGKGKLGNAVEEALKKWVHEQKQKEIAESLKEKMRTCLYSVGKGWKFNREEIYDRQ